jgi:hypothetical protein
MGMLWSKRSDSSMSIELWSHDVTDPTIHAQYPYSIEVRARSGELVCNWVLRKPDLEWLVRAIEQATK